MSQEKKIVVVEVGKNRSCIFNVRRGCTHCRIDNKECDLFLGKNCTKGKTVEEWKEEIARTLYEIWKIRAGATTSWDLICTAKRFEILKNKYYREAEAKAKAAIEGLKKKIDIPNINTRVKVGYHSACEDIEKELFGEGK